MTFAPGQVRDSIIRFLQETGSGSLEQIYNFVRRELGDVPASSVRSYLNLNCPEKFTRLATGRYALVGGVEVSAPSRAGRKGKRIGLSMLFVADCMSWLTAQEGNSVHALITDPPYGLQEYTAKEQSKLRAGKGGAGESRHHSTVTNVLRYHVLQC